MPSEGHVSFTGGPFPKDTVAAVVLNPTRPSKEQTLPVISLNGSGKTFPRFANAGTDSVLCTAVLPEDVGASRLQCQFVVLSFEYKCAVGRLQEALFLRDLAEERRDMPTLVNGKPAIKPLQWLHDGDVVELAARLESRAANKGNRGIAITASGSANTWPMYSVQYARHVQKARYEILRLGEEYVGKVMDVTYPPSGCVRAKTYRVRVASFDAATGEHGVNSHGYSKWSDDEGSGESFTDILDLGLYCANGHINFVSDEEHSDAPSLQKRKRPRRDA